MAIREDRSRVTLEIDGNQAINQLGRLEMEARQLAIDMRNARRGTQEYVDASRRLRETEGHIRQIRQELGLAGMTMTQLSRYQRDLRREIQNTTTVGTARYRELRTELHSVTTELTRQRRALNPPGGGGFFDGLTASLRNFGAAAGIMFTAGGIIQGFRSVINNASEFEQSMSNLSAITGATGDQLTELEMAARRIGSTTSLSAQQTADAFTIIASKKPELLENSEALIATTEATIMLAEAAGIELPEAADALTNSLNQFGYSADESQRFVNVLAAGAKFGAGEIDYLNDAVKRFGPVAASMNISFEQSVAMMEVFAEKGLESEKAGTQFRNILVKLASGAEETNPAIVGMTTALENLGKQQLDTAELAKMFGNENLVGAQIMIESAARFDDLTQKVTGTNEAMVQANARLDNFKGDMKSLTSITEEYAIVIGSLITDALRPMVQGFTAFLIAMRETPKFIKENKDLLVALGIALVTFNSAQIISTALMLKDIAVRKAQAAWTAAVTTAQTLLNGAMTANPIGLVIKAVALLTAGFVVLYNRSETVRAGIAGIAEVAVTVWEIIKETFGAITDGFKDIFDGNFADGMKKLGTAFIKSNPIGLALTEGKRLAEAFQKGYADKLASEQGVDAMVGSGGESMISATSPIFDPTDSTPTGAPTNDDPEEFAKGVESLFQSTLDKAKQNRKLTLGDTKLMYDQLTDLGAQFGVDMKALAEKRAQDEEDNLNRITESEIANANARIMVAQGLSQAIGATIDLIGNKSGEMTTFQKILAVAQIAIDSAVALAKAPKLSAEGASGSGPAAPLVFAANLATISGIILTSIVRAKNVLSSSNVPEWNSDSGEKANTGRSRPPSTAPRKSFYYGGDTGNLGMGLGDQYGDFTGFVHANEYVIPSMTVSDPYIANLMPAIEQIRQDNIKGFSSMAGANSGMSTAKMEKLLIKIAAGIERWPKEIKGKWVITDLEEATDERDYLTNRYRA
jgi:TP901 family phage tail tape measure protein